MSNKGAWQAISKDVIPYLKAKLVAGYIFLKLSRIRRIEFHFKCELPWLHWNQLSLFIYSTQGVSLLMGQTANVDRGNQGGSKKPMFHGSNSVSLLLITCSIELTNYPVYTFEIRRSC